MEREEEDGDPKRRENHFQAPDGCLGRWGLQSLTAVPKHESSMIGTKGSNNTHTHTSPSTQRRIVIRSSCIDFFYRGIYGEKRNTVIVHGAAGVFISFNWPAVLFNRFSAGTPHHRCQRGDGESWESSGFTERANDPSADGRRLQSV